MQPVTIARGAIAVAFACVALHSQAQWVGLLKNTPAEQFDEVDMRLLLDAAKRALDETPVKGTVSWQNPKTRSQGEITVLSSLTWQSHPCRKLKMVNETTGRKSTIAPTLCRIDERWRAVSASQLARP